mgnify:CR=1 FL=1
MEPHKMIRVTLPGKPRTKKTSNRIVRFGRNKEHIKVMPSEAYEEWLDEVLSLAPIIRSQLKQAGANLPIANEVSVAAIVYRDRNQGDLIGFLNAIADAIQAPQFNDRNKCIRKGLGLIEDDRQIVCWDGSRMLVDAQRPRVELEIEIIGAEQGRLL